MSPINIPAILIANIMGITILFAIAVENSWQTKKTFHEYKSLKTMFCICAVSCVADPICFLADGKPGVLNFWLVFGCNTWLFVGNIANALLWIQLLANRLGLKLHPLHKAILLTGACINLFLLIANFFVPIVFSVSEHNVYARASLYPLNLVYFLVVLADGLILYLIERQKSGKLKFFPVLAFIQPTAVGMIIQFLFYGVSTITPFITVSLTCIFLNLQNEFLYRDKLTGLYNRFFLEIFEKKICKNTKQKYTLMMVDVNRFKQINDVYGHNAGDQALIQVSNILRDVVGVRGEAVRYAGDEFILILNTHDDDVIQRFIQQIHQAFSTFSSSGATPYSLSVSLGYSKFYVGTEAMNGFIDRIDKHMYDNKRAYYEANTQFDRRDQ